MADIGFIIQLLDQRRNQRRAVFKESRVLVLRDLLHHRAAFKRRGLGIVFQPTLLRQAEQVWLQVVLGR